MQTQKYLMTQVLWYNGLCIPVEVSTQMLPWLNGTRTSTIFKDGMSVQSESSVVRCLAISCMSTVVIALTSVRDSASATMLRYPLTCRTSAVNWPM